MPEVFSHEEKPHKKAGRTSAKSTKKTPAAVASYSQTVRDEGVCRSPFAAFSTLPDRARFENQIEGEIIILALRKHPLTNLPWIVLSILLFFFPMFVQILPIVEFLSLSLRIVLMMGWYLLLTGFVLEKFLSWFFNINLITDERIVDIDFENLVYKRVSSAKLDNVEDVTSSTGGFIRSLLGFGTVLIQTAAEKTEFEFIDVPQPEKVVKIMNELLLEEEQEKLEGRVR